MRAAIGAVRRFADPYLYKYRWMRFGLVGLLGAVIGYPILYALTEFAGLHYIVSAVCSILVASTHNYYLNNRWTFKEKRRYGFKSHVRGWLSYQVLAAAGDGAYLGLMVVFTELAGMWYMLSAIVALVAAFAFKYAFAAKVIWRAKSV